MQVEGLIKHDARFLKLDILKSSTWSGGHILPGKWKKETSLYLYHFPQYPSEQKIIVGSVVSLKNNSSFAILNVSIYSKDAEKVVLSINKLFPNKSIQFELNKEGGYALSYSIANHQKIEERKFKVISGLIKPPRHNSNFDPQLKPGWY